MYFRYPEAVARRQIKEEIKRIVADAQESGSLILTAYHAARLFTTYHDAHFSIGRIVDEIIVEASAAKVPVHISRPN